MIGSGKAYYDTAIIATVKSFIVQAPVLSYLNLLFILLDRLATTTRCSWQRQLRGGAALSRIWRWPTTKTKARHRPRRKSSFRSQTGSLSCRRAGPSSRAELTQSNQGILKGEVSLYHWPPVWLVWNPLYDNGQFLFIFAKQTNPNQSNRRSMV